MCSVCATRSRATRCRATVAVRRSRSAWVRQPCASTRSQVKPSARRASHCRVVTIGRVRAASLVCLLVTDHSSASTRSRTRRPAHPKAALSRTTARRASPPRGQSRARTPAGAAPAASRPARRPHPGSQPRARPRSRFGGGPHLASSSSARSCARDRAGPRRQQLADKCEKSRSRVLVTQVRVNPSGFGSCSANEKQIARCWTRTRMRGKTCERSALHALTRGSGGGGSLTSAEPRLQRPPNACEDWPFGQVRRSRARFLGRGAWFAGAQRNTAPGGGLKHRSNADSGITLADLCAGIATFHNFRPDLGASAVVCRVRT
jgi:hypothetical protein